MSSKPTAGEARTGEEVPNKQKSDDEKPFQTGGPLITLSAFQRDVLWTLAKRGGMKGLSIKQALEVYYDEHVNHGQLYPNLDELASLGLVNKGRRDLRTNEYTLTRAGRKALQTRRKWTEDTEGGAE